MDSIEDAIRSRNCPQCKTNLPVFEDFVTWCHSCGWNLAPQQVFGGDGLFARIYANLGQKHSWTLFGRITDRRPAKARFSIGTCLVLVFSFIVLLSSPVAAFGGSYLLVRHWNNLFAFFGGAFFVLAAFLLRPRFLGLTGRFNTREELPEMFELLDRISTALKAPPVRKLNISEELNAWVLQEGWKRETVLSIGLPFWSILGPQERIALLAHEIAHTVNGDPARSSLPSKAIRTLNGWHDLVLPDRLWDPRAPLSSLFGLPFSVLLIGIAKAIQLSARIYAYLFWRESQKAEYYADALSAQVSGTKAAINLMAKSSHWESFRLVVQKAAIGHEPLDIIESFKQRINQIPAREKERIRRVQMLDGSQLDASHPPTPLRVAMLQAFPVDEPRIVACEAEMEKIDTVLRQFSQSAQKKLVEQYRAALYV